MISKRFESAVMASKIGVPVLTKELPELYESGQYFINPQFGYRGVVLFPQQVRVLHDKQLSTDSVSPRVISVTYLNELTSNVTKIVLRRSLRIVPMCVHDFLKIFLDSIFGFV